MQGVHLRKYGVEATIDFEVYEVDGVDLRVDWVPAQADCEIMKDGGASTQCDNTATDEGSTFSIVLTATEMQFARGVIKIVDAATKVFLDKVIVIETYGNASAQHAMDFDTVVPTATNIVDDWETQSQADPTGFHVNVKEVNGTAQTANDDAADINTILSRVTGNVALASVVGALADAAADGEVTEADTLMKYVKQLINILIGAPGIVAFPAEQAPANGISLAEVIRAIHADVTGLNGSAMVGTNSAATEAKQDIIDTNIDQIETAVITNAAGDDIAADIIAVKAETANILADTDDIGVAGAGLTDLGGMSAGMKAEINAEALDVLNTDTFAEPGQEAPPATTTLVKKIGYLYKFLRNKITDDGTNIKVFNDAGAVVDQKDTVSEAGGTVTRGKFGSGP